MFAQTLWLKVMLSKLLVVDSWFLSVYECNEKCYQKLSNNLHYNQMDSPSRQRIRRCSQLAQLWSCPNYPLWRHRIVHMVFWPNNFPYKCKYSTRVSKYLFEAENIKFRLTRSIDYRNYRLLLTLLTFSGSSCPSANEERKVLAKLSN